MLDDYSCSTCNEFEKMNLAALEKKQFIFKERDHLHA